MDRQILYDLFHIQNCFNHKDALLFNTALEYAIRKIKASQEGLNLNGSHTRLLCAHDVNALGNTRAMKKNPEALLLTSKEGDLKYREN
jgi:hypothetical protein